MAEQTPDTCSIEVCGAVRVTGTTMCARHNALVPRALKCALRRAWRDGDGARVATLTARAVHDVQAIVCVRGECGIIEHHPGLQSPRQ